MDTTHSSPRDIHLAWEARFHQSAGTLASQFLRGLAEGRLLGWRSGTPERTAVPPQDPGLPGQWVEVGPRARLLAHDGDGLDVLGLVAIENAHGCSYWRVRCSHTSQLRHGLPLVARFAEQRTGSPLDLWFEPESAA